MKTYTIYFEIFGKKLKTTVHAESEEQAKEQVRSKVNFHKITADERDLADIMREMIEYLGGVEGNIKRK